jgi:hypothetical protein
MTENRSEHLIRREHYVTGREDERERIIEMLQVQHELFLADGGGDLFTAGFSQAIDMIRGEE